MTAIENWVAQIRAGDVRAISRAISAIENRTSEAETLLRDLFPFTGKACRVGITGAPGTGKSTLADRLAANYRAHSKGVGIIAVDPSSPFTGGAILGDRIRMQRHSSDEGVFIRSMATRGHRGGLARAVPQAIRVLAAAGHDWIVVETVGVGQVEVEIAGTADTTVVVVNPGWGDGVQAAKAGLLEIGDVFVVNKADRDGVAATVHDLQGMLDLAGERAWRPPVLETVATTDRGVDALVDAIDRHRASEEGSGDLAQRREQRIADEIRALVLDRLIKQADDFCSGTRFATVVRRVADGESDPYTAATLLTEGDDGGEA
jgi:LAO/AO transport system kinase